MDQRNGANRFRWRQWLATLSATLTMVYVGGRDFWMIKTMSDYYSYEDMWVENLDRRWTVVYPVTATSGVIGAVLGALLADNFGRKTTLLLTCIFSVCQILSTLTTNIILSWVTLFLGGIGLGITRVVVPLFVSEIVDDDIRGTLLMVQLPLFYCGRILAVWTMSFYVIEIFGVVSEILTGIFLVSFLWFPETPYYLISKKNYEAASKSLAFYRTVETAAADDEVNLIIKNIELDNISQGFSGKIRELARLNNRNSLLIIVFLVIVQWSVRNFYPQNFLEDVLTDLPLRSHYDSMIIANVIRLIASILILFTIDVIGRRSLLVSATYGCFTMAIISIIFRAYGTTEQVWMNYGFGITSHFCLLIICSVLLVYIGELFSTNVKGMAIAIVTVVDLSTSVILIAPWISVHSDVNSFILSIVLLLAFPITIVFAPETMRKSFSDIQTKLSKPLRLRSSRNEV